MFHELDVEEERESDGEFGRGMRSMKGAIRGRWHVDVDVT